MRLLLIRGGDETFLREPLGETEGDKCLRLSNACGTGGSGRRADAAAAAAALAAATDVWDAEFDEGGRVGVYQRLDENQSTFQSNS